MSAPGEANPVVYVVTDLGQPAEERKPSPREILAELLYPLIAPATVAVPILATTALAFGLLLGWHPGILMVVAVLALPILINLIDLLGARVGWPPLSWTAARIAETEEPTDD